MPKLESGLLTTFIEEIGCQKLGHPVPESNFAWESRRVGKAIALTGKQSGQLLLKISVGVGLRETDAVGYDIHRVILRLKSSNNRLLNLRA